MVGSRGSLLIFAIALSVALAFPRRQYPAVAQCMVTGAKVPVCVNPGSATSRCVIPDHLLNLRLLIWGRGEEEPGVFM